MKILSIPNDRNDNLVDLESLLLFRLLEPVRFALKRMLSPSFSLWNCSLEIAYNDPKIASVIQSVIHFRQGMDKKVTKYTTLSMCFPNDKERLLKKPNRCSFKKFYL